MKLPAFLALALAVALTAPAIAQPASQKSKLVVQYINFNRAGDGGFYNANVGVTLQPAAQGNVTFNFYLQHVKTVEEVREKIKPLVDQLADEAKAAADHFEPHQ